MSAFISFVNTVFGGAWELFQLQVPGFTFSYGDIIVAGLVLTVGWSLISFALGVGGGSASHGRSTRNPKISKERMNDEK